MERINRDHLRSFTLFLNRLEKFLYIHGRDGFRGSGNATDKLAAILAVKGLLLQHAEKTNETEHTVIAWPNVILRTILLPQRVGHVRRAHQFCKLNSTE